MYLRKTTKTYKGKVHTNYVLVESVRTAKGPRQKVICSLGDLRPRPRAEWLKLAHQVETALVGQEELFEEATPEVERIIRKIRRHEADSKPSAEEEEKGQATGDRIWVDADRVGIERPREAGSVHVGYQFWRRLGMDEILREIGLNERACPLTCAMVLNRLIQPCSEYAMPGWIRTTALDDILGVDFEDLREDTLYRNLDKLYPNRGVIESRLVEKERSLFNLEGTVYFYDLTSTYFEGQALKNGKAKRGYSRDKRPDCKQVVMGLVVGKEGFPLAHEIFEGNQSDTKSLGPMLELLDQRVGLKEGQTVVVDRGMAFEENIKEIKQRKLHYIVASRQGEREEWLEEFEEEEGFEEVEREPSPRNRFQKKSVVQVKRKRKGEEVYGLCISSGRIEKDRAIREKQQSRLVSDLRKLAQRIEQGRLVKERAIGEAMGRLKERYPRVARYYRIEYDSQSRTLSYPLDEEKTGKAESLDGSYILRTDRQDLSADEVWRIYMLLTRAENAFRNMKSPLAERSIFHQLERRVETHIFLCVLAYHLLVAIEKTLLDKGVHTSWGTVREVVKTHQIATIVLPSDQAMTLKIRKGSTPEPQHIELYQLLEIPKQIIRPKKMWVEERAECSD
jgi:transposase